MDQAYIWLLALLALVSANVLMTFYSGDEIHRWLDAAIGNPPFTGGDDGGVVMYERTQDGVTYIVCGTRRYEVTPRGNLRLIGDVAPVAPASWWKRLLAWLRRLLGV